MRDRRTLRLLLTVLLFGGLGLTTSIAIAWGATIHSMSLHRVRAGVMTENWTGFTVYRGVSRWESGVPVWRLPETDTAPRWSDLNRPPRDSHTKITVYEAGWPFRSLGYELHRDSGNRQVFDLGQHGALYGSLQPVSKINKDWAKVSRLPISINYLGLLADSLFWMVVWFLSFSIPSMWRVNQWKLRRPKRHCAWCNYDMNHSEGEICPECGNDQSQRPSNISRPGLIMASLFLFIVVCGLIGIGRLFVTERKNEPIHWAAYLGDVELVKQELARRIDVDIKAGEGACKGLTPLHLAVLNNRKEVANILLEAGAKMRGRIYLYDPPEIAVENGLTEIMGMLIEHGLDVNVPSADGKTFLERAAAENHFDVVDVLLEAGADEKVLFSGMASLLHLAVEFGHKDFAEKLIKRGHDVNLKDGAGQTPLLSAVRQSRYRARRTRSDQSEITRMLIAHGAAVDLGDDNGVEPIHVWARRGNTEILRLLIEKGADVNKATSNGSTPLMLAAGSYNYDAVELLLGHGADVNKVKRSGFTELRFIRGALHSWERISPRVVHLIPLNYSFDVNEPEGQKWSPLARAIIQENKDITNILLDHGAEIDVKVLGAALCTDQYELFNDLIVRGGDVLEKHPSGETLLFYRSDSSSLEIWKSLIGSGVDVNAVNQKGETALMKAASAGRPHLVRFLLNHDADPTVRMPDGSTVLDNTEDPEILGLLEEAIAAYGKE